MSTKCLKLINQGQFEIIPITEELYEAAVQLFRESFLKYENLCTACNVLESKESTDDLIQHLKDMFKDGISFAARHVESKELAALCANKFVSCNSDSLKSEAAATQWSPSPNLQKIKQFLDYVESTHDIYKLWQLECVIDLTFLCTKPEFGRKGLALSLAAYTLDYCRRLKDVNSLEYQALPQHLQGQHPQALTAIFTSKYTQSIGDKLGFTTIHEAHYKDFSYGGQTFAEKIDPQHSYANFAAIRL